MRATHLALARRTLAALVTVVGAGALLFGTPERATAGWDGEQRIHLGDKVASMFVDEAGAEVHKFRFFASLDTKLSVTLKTGKGASLVPELKLFDAVTDLEVPLGGALSNGKTVKIKNFMVQATGHYYLQVVADSGTGDYSMTTKGKAPKVKPLTTQELSTTFDGLSGGLLNATAKKGKKSGAVPVFESLTGPFGPITITEGAKLSNVTLPDDGTYTLEWRNDGADGDMKISIKTKPPRKMTLGFGAAEPVRAVPDTIRAEWMTSGHADVTAEAFRHWDEDGEISTRCAKCHSSYGYQDFLGDDGTPAQENGTDPTDNPAALGSTVDCNACHNPTAQTLSTVAFPSGAVLTDAGPEARCMTCHQGRESTVSVEDEITDGGTQNPAPDDVSAWISFQNIHYYAAGVTLMGGTAQGGYQYATDPAGDTLYYDGRNPHVSSHDVCQECHDKHTLQLKLNECATCHTNVTTKLDLDDIRMAGSVRDYDGDGDTVEGVKNEIADLGAKLLTAIEDYALGQLGVGIQYDSHSYPYWFVAGSEPSFGSRYTTWSPRLLRAAYNYQYWQKDPGAFAHNPKYVIQLLYDSLADLNSNANVTVMGFADMWRGDSGHFDGGAEAYRHWDDQNVPGEPPLIDRGEVDASCALCHSPGGFEFRAEFGLDPNTSFDVSDGLRCETCHVGGDFGDPSPARKLIPFVDFPSGITIELEDSDPGPGTTYVQDDSFICMTCHKGRNAKSTVDARTASPGPYTFRQSNIHYYPAGATLYGTDVEVGYEYNGKTYAGKWDHTGGTSAQCATCHGADHSFEAQLTASCTMCHPEAGGNIHNIRRDRPIDYDGDGDNTEPLPDEIQTLGDALLDEMKAYAAANMLPAIGYHSSSYPYFFVDTDGNGTIEDTEASFGNQYSDFDEALLRAAFNYQYWQKEPGAWAHNTNYIVQLLFDSIDDLGGDVTGFNRP